MNKLFATWHHPDEHDLDPGLDTADLLALACHRLAEIPELFDALHLVDIALAKVTAWFELDRGAVGGERQGDAEGEPGPNGHPAAGAGLDPHGALQRLDELGHDPHPEARRPVRPEADRFLEGLRGDLRRDAGPSVEDGQLDEAVGSADVDLDGFVGRRVLRGVLQQVGQNPKRLLTVCPEQGDAGIDVRDEPVGR